MQLLPYLSKIYFYISLKELQSLWIYNTLVVIHMWSILHRYPRYFYAREAVLPYIGIKVVI